MNNGATYQDMSRSSCNSSNLFRQAAPLSRFSSDCSSHTRIPDMSRSSCDSSNIFRQAAPPSRVSSDSSSHTRSPDTPSHSNYSSANSTSTGDQATKSAQPGQNVAGMAAQLLAGLQKEKQERKKLKERAAQEASAKGFEGMSVGDMAALLLNGMKEGKRVTAAPADPTDFAELRLPQPPQPPHLPIPGAWGCAGGSVYQQTPPPPPGMWLLEEEHQRQQQEQQMQHQLLQQQQHEQQMQQHMRQQRLQRYKQQLIAQQQVQMPSPQAGVYQNVNYGTDAIASCSDEVDDDHNFCRDPRKETAAALCARLPPQMPAGQALTTMMVRNVPVMYTQDMLVLEWPSSWNWDFLYLPRTCFGQSNLSFAFVNFVTEADAAAFKAFWEKRRLSHYNARKALNISYADVQGIEANLIQLKKKRVRRVKIHQCQPIIMRNGSRIPLEDVMAEIAAKYAEAAPPPQPTAPGRGPAVAPFAPSTDLPPGLVHPSKSLF